MGSSKLTLAALFMMICTSFYNTRRTSASMPRPSKTKSPMTGMTFSLIICSNSGLSVNRGTKSLDEKISSINRFCRVILGLLRMSMNIVPIRGVVLRIFSRRTLPTNPVTPVNRMFLSVKNSLTDSYAFFINFLRFKMNYKKNYI